MPCHEMNIVLNLKTEFQACKDHGIRTKKLRTRGHPGNIFGNQYGF